MGGVIGPLAPRFQTTTQKLYQHQQGYQGTIPTIPSQEGEQATWWLRDRGYVMNPKTGARTQLIQDATKVLNGLKKEIPPASCQPQVPQVQPCLSNWEFPGNGVDVPVQTHQDALEQEMGMGSQDFLQVLNLAAFRKLEQEMGDARGEELQAVISRANVAGVEGKTDTPKEFPVTKQICKACCNIQEWFILTLEQHPVGLQGHP